MKEMRAGGGGERGGTRSSDGGSQAKSDAIRALCVHNAARGVAHNTNPRGEGESSNIRSFSHHSSAAAEGLEHGALLGTRSSRLVLELVLSLALQLTSMSLESATMLLQLFFSKLIWVHMGGGGQYKNYRSKPQGTAD